MTALVLPWAAELLDRPTAQAGALRSTCVRLPLGQHHGWQLQAMLPKSLLGMMSDDRLCRCCI